MKYLPDVYIRHLALLVGGLFRLLKESITPEDREKSASFLKLSNIKEFRIIVLAREREQRALPLKLGHECHMPSTTLLSY